VPIPPFDDNGVLPAGIHECSLDELRERFGQFQRTDQRCQLCERLETFLQRVQATGFFAFVIVDGSFVTATEHPNDIDLILALRANHDFTIALRPFEYNVLSKRQIRREFGFDVLIAREDRQELGEYLDFFAQIRQRPGICKGLVRISL
jgi:Family of unknown function (DUF6932)